MSEPIMEEVTWEQPDYGIVSMPNAVTGKQLIGMQITTSSTLHRFYLCGTENYADVARELHKLIMDAGVEAKRTESGLIVAKGGLPDGFVQPSERRVKRGPRG